MNKKYFIGIFIFVSVIFFILIFKSIIDEKNRLDTINKHRETKILSLNNISEQITFEELLDIEMSKEYFIKENNLKYENDLSKKDFTVEYNNTSFYGARCIKKYSFVDEKLRMVIITIDNSHWMPKDIFIELKNLNGEPDKSSLKEYDLGSDVYDWYGKNGIIVYTDDNISNTLEIIFELNQLKQ